MIKKYNKKGLEFKSGFYAIIAIALMVTAVGTIIGEWNNSYQSGLTYDLQEYDQSSKISQDLQSQKDSIGTQSVGTSTESFEGTTLRGVFGVVANLYKSFDIVFGNGGMVDSVTERFGIPDYVRQGIIMIFLAAITFTLIAIILTKFNRTI